MLKSAFRFLSHHQRFYLHLPKVLPALKTSSCTSSRYFSSARSYSDTALVGRPEISNDVNGSSLNISNNIKSSETLTELFFNIERYNLYLNVVHVSLLVKKAYELMEPESLHNPMVELQYMSLVKLVVQKVEAPGEEMNSKIITSMYHFMSLIPASSPIIKRCKFILEQKGMMMVNSMDSLELSRFFSALIRNDKILFAKALLCQVSQHIDGMKVGRLAYLLNNITMANIQTPEFVHRVEEVVEKNSIIEKLRTLELSLFLHFFVKNQHLIKNPAVFGRFENRAIMIKNYFDPDILKAVLDTICRADTQVFSKHFYKEFESKLWQKVSEMSDDFLLLLFQENHKFLFESTALGQRLVAEVFDRAKRMSSDSLAMVFSTFTLKNGFFPQVLNKFTYIFNKGRFTSLKFKEFENMFNALYQFHTTCQVKPSQDMKQLCLEYIMSRADTLSLQDFESILEKRSFFPEAGRKDLVAYVQSRIIQGTGLSKDDLNLRTLCNISNIYLLDFPKESKQEFIHAVIDLSMALVLESIKDENVNVEDSLEVYGKFLSVMSQQNLDKLYVEKRKKLFQIFEQHLIKLCEQSHPVFEKPVVEDSLSKYVNALYSILEKPVQDTEKMHRYGLA